MVLAACAWLAAPAGSLEAQPRLDPDASLSIATQDIST
jgi:hypothetical protein